jgi:hypothetical protein
MIVAGGNFRFSTPSVGGDWFWSVDASNIINDGQLIQVKDIQTPFGPLSVSNIPIPSSVILAMADSLTQFQQQLAPVLRLLTPATYSFTVTESAAAMDAAAMQFQNVGAFGSFMSVSATPDASWLTASPPSVGGLGKNQTGQSEARILPASMLASSSPYTGHITLQDSANPPNSVAITFNVIVLPRPTIGLSIPSIGLTYHLLTSVGTSAIEVITNVGPALSSMSFSLAKVQNQSQWLSIVPISGGPLGSGNSVSVLFSIVGIHAPTITGNYSETIRLTAPSATNSPIDIPVTLSVVP